MNRAGRCVALLSLVLLALAATQVRSATVYTVYVVSLLEQIRTPAKELDEEMVRVAGADRIGMKKYVLAFLKSGPKRDQDAETAARLQREHMANIGRMAREGKLLLAGPFMDNGELRGIYLFNTESLDEAREWTNTDPAVKAGRLDLDLHPWYGSAAMMFVNDLHSRMDPSQFVKDPKE